MENYAPFRTAARLAELSAYSRIKLLGGLNGSTAVTTSSIRAVEMIILARAHFHHHGWPAGPWETPCGRGSERNVATLKLMRYGHRFPAGEREFLEIVAGIER